MGYSRFVSTIAAVCVSVGLLAGSASAAEEEEKKHLAGLYGGAGIGLSTSDDPDDNEYAWRMNVWWRPLDYASLEIGYIDAGHRHGKSEIDGLHLAVVPTFPLPKNFDIYGKLGGFFWDQTSVSVGLGLAYHLPRNFGLRLDWDLLTADEDSSVNVLTLGAFYQFAHSK